jgi:hypothetical protein
MHDTTELWLKRHDPKHLRQTGKLVKVAREALHYLEHSVIATEDLEGGVSREPERKLARRLRATIYDADK